MVMAAPISASASLCSSSAGSKSSLCTLSSSVPYQKTSKSQLSPWFFQVGASLFSSYSGLKHLGLSISSKSLKLERKRRCRGKVIHASLFGVGAPEALVIGVVALLVFGPKGLAEVARNLGKTLRTFQPTIRELQEVSREFKSTLEREIGLDDIATQNTNSPSRTNLTSAPPSAATTPDPSSVTEPNDAPSPSRAYTSEEYLKVTEEQLKATAVQQTEQTAPEEESQIEHETQSQATVRETTAATPPIKSSDGQR